VLRDILAVVEGGERATPAIGQALECARVFQAHLNVTVVTERMMLTAAFDPLGQSFPEPGIAEAHAAHLAAVRKLADQAPVDCEVRGICQEPLFIPGEADFQSRCSDLTIIGAEPYWSDRRLRRRIVDAILIDAAAPVLLSPADWKPQRIRHAVLGWNESAEASRAARVLRSLLEPGARIDVVVGEPLYTPDGRSSSPGAAIVDHFARHRFEAELHVCRAGGRPMAETLESFSIDRGAQLLAVGAYAHTRLRELVLGGVTREFMAFQRLPILMVH